MQTSSIAEGLEPAMTETAINAVVRRDRAVVVAAIITISVLAWAYTLWLAAQMSGMETPAIVTGGDGIAGIIIGGMNAAAEPALRSWSISDIALISIMWAVMMVAMMTPSVATMVVLYAAVARKAAASGRPLVATGWFLAGYLSAWIIVSFAACSAQWILTRHGLLTSLRTSGMFAGFVLIEVGLYQWSPLKDICLKQCQKPL